MYFVIIYCQLPEVLVKKNVKRKKEYQKPGIQCDVSTSVKQLQNDEFENLEVKCQFSYRIIDFFDIFFIS